METNSINLKVLVVDDDVMVRKIHKMSLQKVGCFVEDAADGEAALKMLDKKYDVIFTDINMPKVDGIQLTTEIRRLGNENNHIPVIGITGHNDSQIKEQCMSVGMNQVFVKPIGLKEFEKIVEQIKEENNKQLTDNKLAA